MEPIDTKKHLEYGSVKEWIKNENVPNGFAQVEDEELRGRYISEYGELRQHLFEKHIKSLTEEDQELFSKGKHPSQSWKFEKRAKPYAEKLQKELSKLNFVEKVSIGYYQMDRIVLSVDINCEVSEEEYEMIPWLYSGFETKVGCVQRNSDMPESGSDSTRRDVLKRFFSISQIRLDKPPLEPKWAIIISLITVFSGLFVVVASHLYFYVSLPIAFLCYAFLVYLSLGISWSFLDWNTRNAAIRGHNYFVYFAIVIFIIAMISTGSYEAFPHWATIALILGAIAGYSIMGFCGIKNFIRWKRGDFKEQEERKATN